MTVAIAGHGALIAMESSPVVGGVFTTIAELNGDISPPGLSRNATEVTPHQDTIDSHVTGVMRRTPMKFSVNFIFDDATHDHLTGLIKKIKDDELTGFRITGPGSPVSPLDEWIASGFVTNVLPVNPVRDGARTAEVEVVMTGPMIVDGVTFS